MLTRPICCLLIGSYLLLSVVPPNYCDDDEYEPPFPHLVTNNKQLKIVSESAQTDKGYRTDEEYLDFERGKLAYVMNDKNGRRSVYLDAPEGLVYSYKPYTCTRSSLREFVATSVGLLDLKSNVELMIDEKLVNFRAFGVAGMWLLASTRPKTYSSSSLIYSASQQMTFKAFTWTVEVKELALELVLHFLQKGADLDTGMPVLYPQIFQVTSSQTKETLTTFNILSVDFEIDEQVYEDLMAPPVGYGCFKTPLDGRPEDLGYLKKIEQEPRMMNMEVVATKYGGQSGGRSTSDVVNLELAFNQWHSIQERLYLVRQKSQRSETKTVYNFRYDVRYEIDSRQGTCKISHLEEEGYPKTIIKFNNELQLDVGLYTQAVLFNGPNFIYVRSSRSPNLPETYWFERNMDNNQTLFDTNKGKFRLIRKYIKANNILDLQSVIIWKLNDEESEILETYQLNMAEVRLLTQSWPDEAKIFDISEECYLNNLQMVSGRDYAWSELTYPAPERILGLLSSHELELKRIFYRNIVKGRLDVIRVPKMELQTSDQSFVVRYLLLDLPALEMVYDREENVCLDLSAPNERDWQSSAVEPTTSHFATDLSHCAQLCRLNYCAKMSYCPGGHTCIISLNKQAPQSASPNLRCDTYHLPEGKFGAIFDLENYHGQGLHSVIGRYQHQDYDIKGLPEQPEEILVPTSESGLSDAQYTQALDDYFNQLIAFLDEQEARLPELALSASVGGHFIVLLPNKFEVENDPLDDFDVQLNGRGNNDDADQLDSRIVSSFHKAMEMSRYKLTSSASKEVDPKQVDMRQFLGLSYEQCATICLDARCGSFSYCYTQRECIVSSANNTAIASDLGLIQMDVDCSIIQRDFLGNYLKYEQTKFPTVFHEMAAVRDPSECALKCISETQFNCLSFDFCAVTRAQDRGNICFYQEGRFGTTRSVGLKDTPDTEDEPEASKQYTCDHYARSFLADFNRLDSRRIADDVLFNLKTTSLADQTVFGCAEKCANDLVDCTAFQFCFSAKSYASLELECTLIESKLPEEEADSSSYNMTTTPDGVRIKEGSNLVHDTNCQLFALKKDSSEAQLRELALGSTVLEATGEADKNKMAETNHWLLFLVVSVVSASIWCAICLARDNNELVRQKIERGRILLGLHR